MDIYQHRKDSFKNFTQFQASENDIENFAHAGFYATKRSTQCFLCGFKKNNWKPDQSPFDVHSQKQPQCPWVVLEFPGCLSYPTLEFNVIELYTVQHACEETFKINDAWPEERLSPIKLSEAGFFYSPTKKHPYCIQCPYCLERIKKPHQNMDFMTEHQKLNASCPFISNSCSSKSNKRKQKEYKEQEEEDEEQDEEQKVDDVWSFEHAFNPPLKLLKPSVTYSKKRKTRSLLQPQPKSQIAFNNIRSTRSSSYSSKKQAIIIQPEPSSAPSKSIAEYSNEQEVTEISSSFDDNLQIRDNSCKVIREFNDEEDGWVDDYINEPIRDNYPTKDSAFGKKRKSLSKDIVEKKEAKNEAPSNSKHKKTKAKIEKLETAKDIRQVFMRQKGASAAASTRKTAPSFFTAIPEVPKKNKGKGRAYQPDTPSSSTSGIKSLNLSRRKKDPASDDFNKIPNAKGTFKNSEFMTVVVKRNGPDAYTQIQTTYDKDGNTKTYTRDYAL